MHLAGRRRLLHVLRTAGIGVRRITSESMAALRNQICGVAALTSRAALLKPPSIALAACHGHCRSRLLRWTRGEIEPNDYRSDNSVAASSSAMACGALSTLIVVIPMSRAGFKLTPRSSR
jgi:hypothetical protein